MNTACVLRVPLPKPLDLIPGKTDRAVGSFDYFFLLASNFLAARWTILYIIV
jgi:hypothetical protein